MRLPSVIRPRFAASLAGLCVLAAAFIVFRLNLPLYEILTAVMTDGRPRAQPFADTGAVVNAAICWHNGVNVYHPSACMAGGMYNYSPLLLRVGYLPLSMRQIMLYGVVLDLAFIFSLSCLPPPGSAGELAVRVMAIISPAVIFATEQANFDVVIFLTVVMGIVLLLREGAISVTSYGVFAVAALAKFYPIVLLALALRENLPRLMSVALAWILGFAVFIWYFHKDMREALGIIPWGLPFGNTFGASNLPFGLALLKASPVFTANLDLADYRIAIAAPLTGLMFGPGTKLLGAAVIFAAFKRAPRFQMILYSIGGGRRAFLLGGILLITGCFFGAQNLEYREIFLIFTLPGLWAMAARQDRGAGFATRRLIAAVVAVLWEAVIFAVITRTSAHFAIAVITNLVNVSYWLLKETLWWWIILQFLTILAAFIQTEAARLGKSLKPNHLAQQHAATPEIQ